MSLRKRMRSQAVETLIRQRDHAQSVSAITADTLRYISTERDRLGHHVERLQTELGAISHELTNVATYDGIVLPTGTEGGLLPYVKELVRDHEELETRIEAVLAFCGGSDDPQLLHIVSLLRGAQRVPNTVEEIMNG